MALSARARLRLRFTASWTVLGLIAGMGGSALAQSSPAAGPSAASPGQSVPPAKQKGTASEQIDPAAAPDAGQINVKPNPTGQGDDVRAPGTDGNAPGSAAADSGTEGMAGGAQDVVVVGARASQISANSRKKNADTATDSIVADDIGSFPDRNVNEALSRVPGVSLNRNEFGEGDAVAVRGNGPDLTRVELDGMGVQSTSGLGNGAGPALSGGRSADLRELSADLVKSIDVVKGSTADQTEGSIGGGIQIKTRSGLDFKKPYFSIRGGAQSNSLTNDWTPDGTVVAAHKFLDGRLGAIVSGDYSKIQNTSSGFQDTTSGNRGYARLYDFDQSPDKTFVYNLGSLGTDLADVRFANSAETPRSLLTKSIAAQSKAQCIAALPYLTARSAAAGVAAITSAQVNQRILEQQSCLNQWNDYTPSLIRNFINQQTEQRYSIDARLDFKIANNWTVYAKGTVANRNNFVQQRSRNPVSVFNANIGGTYVDTTAATPYPRLRTVSPSAPAGYYLFDPQYGLNTVGNIPTLGNVLNVVPGSVKVDANHNVTSFTTTNNTAGFDQLEDDIRLRSNYLQLGTEYHGDRWEVEAMAGRSRGKSLQEDFRTTRNYLYGDSTLTLQPNGLFDTTVPTGYDENNPANYVQLAPATCTSGTAVPPACMGQAAQTISTTQPVALPAYTVAQLPLVTPSISETYSPRLGKDEEQQARLDITYHIDDQIPFITRLKFGAMYRKNSLDFWGGGGYTAKAAIGTPGQPGYVPAIIVPTANVRGTARACLPSATSTVSCNYGFVASTDYRNVRSGVDTLTPQQLTDLFAKTLENVGASYFGDYPERANLPGAWPGTRATTFLQQLGGYQFMNTDCLITCVANDGNTYDQPVSRTRETIFNAYTMVNFEQRLPHGLLFNGNVGLRGVYAKVKGSGLFTLSNVSVTGGYIPVNPTDTTNTVTTTISFNETVDKTTKDILPTFNLNLWAFDKAVVLRAYGGKTIARPNPSNLLPSGTCTVDQRLALTGSDSDFGCSGRAGNPGLKPFTAWSYNASLEWYPNQDTVFSVAFARLDVKIGNPIAVTQNITPFAGTDTKDPATGQSLADVVFAYPTYDNGPGYKRNIIEFNAKTAFTQLPWLLRYTGVDTNLSILKSTATQGTQDPLTAEIQRPPNESKYTYNASVWYDDGKFNLRVSYQRRTSQFVEITPGLAGNTTDINYPGNQWGNVRLVAPGYNPGVARFLDATTYIDFKAAYNVTPFFQVYLEGRNMGREAQISSFGPYERFADGTERVASITYGGRRILTGLRLQFGK